MKSASGADVPVHMRYAIDKKPMYYKTFPRKRSTWYSDKTNEVVYVYYSQDYDLFEFEGRDVRPPQETVTKQDYHLIGAQD
jgi:hypothetical protein